MNELKYIKDGLNKHGRTAYENAKSAGNAVILKGNSICSVGRDGKKVVISKITKSSVRVNSQKYRLKQNSIVKRLRVFAGPNGSGKSTIVQIVREAGVNMGIYCNADDYKISINNTHTFDFDSCNLILHGDNFLQSVKESSLFREMQGDELLTKVSFRNNKIIFF